MTTEAVKLELQPRTVLGKKVKQLRRAGIIPVHLYGPGMDSRSFQCEQREILRALARSGGTTPVIITVEGESGEQLTFPREVQWHPVRGDILHVDFIAVSSTQQVTAQVPINLAGDAPVGSTAVQLMRELTVEALPMGIPSGFTVDLGILDDPTGVVRVSDIAMPSGVTVLSDREELVVRLDTARDEEVAEGSATDAGENA